MGNESTKPLDSGIQLRGLLKVTGFAACLATLPGFFCQFFWILDLISHFRVHYQIGLAKGQRRKAHANGFKKRKFYSRWAS